MSIVECQAKNSNKYRRLERIEEGIIKILGENRNGLNFNSLISFLEKRDIDFDSLELRDALRRTQRIYSEKNPGERVVYYLES